MKDTYKGLVFAVCETGRLHAWNGMLVRDFGGLNTRIKIFYSLGIEEPLKFLSMKLAILLQTYLR